MAKVVVYGTGQMASLVHAYLTHDSAHDVVAFTVTTDHLTSESLHDLPVVPFERITLVYPPDKFSMLIAVGFERVNRVRAEKYFEAKELGYVLLTYVHSTAVVWPDLVIGDNCVVMENTVIQPFAAIGNNVTLGTGSCVGHHSLIGDHCLLASHVDISGNVTIGPYSFLGANSTVRNGVSIAAECVIGANALILHDTMPQEVYVAPRTELLRLPSTKLPRI